MREKRNLKKEELVKKALKIIDGEHKPKFYDDLACLLGICRSSFYNHQLDKHEDIKEGILKNKIMEKMRLRKKWSDSDNATLQISNYKLLANKDELDRLSRQNVEIGKKQPSATENIDIDNFPSDILDELEHRGFI